MVRNLIALLCIVLMVFCTACSSSEHEYQFPLQKSDIKKAIFSQKLEWEIENIEDVDSRSFFTLKNNEGAIFGISSGEYDTGKILNMTWSLPSEFSTDQFNKFYQKNLPELFELSGELYGNRNELKTGLKEFLKYYNDLVDEFKGEIFWVKRIGNDHVQIDIKPSLGSTDDRNRMGTLFITHNKSYEDYLRKLSESWSKTAEIQSIEVENSVVSNIKSLSNPDKDEEFYGKHFIIQGKLENIEEIKTVPESLKNIKSNHLKSNRDKYLSAKLVDDTGSVDVFVQSTSLNVKELSKKRNHNVVLLYYKNIPILVVRFSPLINKSEE